MAKSRPAALSTDILPCGKLSINEISQTIYWFGLNILSPIGKRMLSDTFLYPYLKPDFTWLRRMLR